MYQDFLIIKVEFNLIEPSVYGHRRHMLIRNQHLSKVK